MSIADDFKKIMKGGEPPEDNLKYRKIDPRVVSDLVSGSYVVCIVSHREYLEMVFRNLEDQAVYFCLHIYNPALVEITAWKAGDNGAKYIIDPTKM